MAESGRGHIRGWCSGYGRPRVDSRRTCQTVRRRFLSVVDGTFRISGQSARRTDRRTHRSAFRRWCATGSSRAECTVCAVRWQRTRLEWTYRCTTVEIFVALGGGAADVGEHQAAARRTPPGKSIAIRCRGGSRRERAEVTVVDASAVIEMLLGTPLGRLCAKRLLEPTEPLCVPQLIYVETAQALRRYALAGELDPGRGSEALARGFARLTADTISPRAVSAAHMVTARYTNGIRCHLCCPCRGARGAGRYL